MQNRLKDFYGNYATEKETSEEIARVYDSYGYVIDTHTAVASRVCGKYQAETGDHLPMVIASTASPYKFARTVVCAIRPQLHNKTDFELIDALFEISGTTIPKAIEDIRTAPVLHHTVVDTQDMPGEIIRWLSI